jgi:hypothetical protein
VAVAASGDSASLSEGSTVHGPGKYESPSAVGPYRV